MDETKTAPRFAIGAMTLTMQNVTLREDVILEEVRIEGADIDAQAPTEPGGQPRLRTGEMKFRAAISEPNLNRLLAANLPPDAPYRNLKVALYSGKARISGSAVKVLSIPFSIDAAPVIANGVRVGFDLKTGSLAGIGLPSAIVEALEQTVNRAIALDLTKLPVPVFLDEAKCEPGRLTLVGRARIAWPLAAAGKTTLPFAPRDLPQIERGADDI